MGPWALDSRAAMSVRRPRTGGTAIVCCSCTLLGKKTALPYRRGLRGFTDRGRGVDAIMIACTPGREWEWRQKRQDTHHRRQGSRPCPVYHSDRFVCGLSRMASASLRALDGGSARDGGSGSCRVLAAQRRHALCCSTAGRARAGLGPCSGCCCNRLQVEVVSTSNRDLLCCTRGALGGGVTIPPPSTLPRGRRVRMARPRQTETGE